MKRAGCLAARRRLPQIRGSIPQSLERERFVMSLVTGHAELSGRRQDLAAETVGTADVEVGLHHIGHLPADWRTEFESDLGILRHQIDTFRTLLNGR